MQRVQQTTTQSSPRNRRLRCTRGQSLVELSIMLPVLLILALGAIDYGRVYFEYVSITNAARNGATYASTGPDEAADIAGIRTAAMNDLGDLPNDTESTVQVTASTGSDANGMTYTVVTVRKTFNTVISWPLLPDGFDVVRSVRMRIGE